MLALMYEPCDAADPFFKLSSESRPGYLGQSQLYIKVYSATITKLDSAVRSAVFNRVFDSKRMPARCGYEFSGIIEAIGPGCKLGHEVGNSVFGVTGGLTSCGAVC